MNPMKKETKVENGDANVLIQYCFVRNQIMCLTFFLGGVVG